MMITRKRYPVTETDSPVGCDVCKAHLDKSYGDPDFLFCLVLTSLKNKRSAEDCLAAYMITYHEYRHPTDEEAHAMVREFESAQAAASSN